MQRPASRAIRMNLQNRWVQTLRSEPSVSFPVVDMGSVFGPESVNFHCLEVSVRPSSTNLVGLPIIFEFTGRAMCRPADKAIEVGRDRKWVCSQAKRV